MNYIIIYFEIFKLINDNYLKTHNKKYYIIVFLPK